MADSMQDRIGRTRPPRVQIRYDVETGKAMKTLELPFVVGVMADLSGMPKEALRPLKDRKFTPIDRDNFNDVMTKATPRLAFGAEDKLTNSGDKLAVELLFKSIEDFEPARVAAQVPAMNKLLEVRQRLKELMSRAEGNDKLQALLNNVLSNTESRQAALDAVKAAAPAGEEK